MLRVVSPYTFPVLPLPWERAPGQRMLTVVVKATFRMIPSGEAVLAEAQDALSGDQPWDNDARAGLHRPTDWVPFKPHAEVMLVGHAYAPGKAPIDALIARLSLGSVDKSLRVFGSRAAQGRPVPFLQIPIREERAARSAENPRGTAGPPNLEPARPDHWPTFGPLHPQSSARRRTVDDQGFQWAYRLSGPMPEGFDGEIFNAAPVEQLLSRIPLGGALRLENLHPDHAVLETRLPSARPRALLDKRELELSADTLWIDSDRGILVITWRGSSPVEASVLAEGTLEIAVDRPAVAPVAPVAPSPTRPAKSALAASFARTVAADDDAPLKPATPFVPAGDPPVQPAAPPKPSKTSPGLDFKTTMEAPPQSAAPQPATPFVPGTSHLASERPSRPPVKREFTGTMLPAEETAAVLPFGGAPLISAPIPVPAPAPIPTPIPVPAPAPIPASLPETGRDPRTWPLPVEQFAAIKSELWRGDAGPREVLARHGLDEGTWQIQERLQAEAIAAEASQGRGDRALSLMSALAGKKPLPRRLDLEAYVAIRVKIERAGGAAAVLDEEGLSAAEWDEIHRGYLRRARREAELRDRLSAMLYTARVEAAAKAGVLS